jgi:hypothetical protein
MPVNIYIHIHIDKNIYITYVYTNTYHLNWRNNYASEYKYIHVHN